MFGVKGGIDLQPPLSFMACFVWRNMKSRWFCMGIFAIIRCSYCSSRG